MFRVDVPARAGLLGNPSDGFFGRTVAIPVRNFSASVILFEWDRIEILPGPTDNVNFDSISELLEDIKVNGYYGGFRLIKAGIKQFFTHVHETGVAIPDKKFTIRYTTSIPRQVGLAGSSAIITATFKALARFYDVAIPEAVMANRVLWAEAVELGIPAGLQDRVVQVYDRPVYMDFDKVTMESQGHGIYTPFDHALLPPLYLAYRVNLTHKDVVHNDVRKRFDCGDSDVHAVMERLAANASTGFDALQAGDMATFKACIDRNFDLRASIYPISPENESMVRAARGVGATAKFPGSGGAIIGTYDDEATFQRLVDALGAKGCVVVRIAT